MSSTRRFDSIAPPVAWFVTLSLALLACGKGNDEPGAAGEPDSDAEVNRRAVLESLAENAIVPVYETAVELTAELERAAEQAAEDPSEDTLAEAQQAWLAAMAQWQIAEVFQVGPAGPSGATAGGLDLRDAIYSWPLTNPCRVDMALVAATYSSESELRDEQPTVFGYDALEYLLFNQELGHACSSEHPLEADGTWAALGEDGVAQRRRDYAAVVAKLIDADTKRLRGAWAPGEGDFSEELAQAGKGSDAYDSVQEALNAATDALFYLEKETKDLKLAVPLGVSDMCPTEICPEDRESKFADVSLDHIRNNLVGFRLAYFAGDAEDDDTFGFDDLLQELGQQKLDEDLQELMGEAFDAVDAVSDPTLVRALEEDRDKVEAAHTTLKALLDLIKTQFLSVLSLSLPQRAASDTD
jgi:uncharacterized iron-regulated protein